MKKEDEEKVSGLPENAYRELKEGEVFNPIMSPQKQYREVTPWSVFWGLVMAVIFSAAAAYLGLKVGQVFEAAIPIAIIAVGLSSGFKRKNALGENVIIQSIGACSGVIVAGAIFTLPALYILQDKYPEITINFFEVFMSSLLGGILGILLLIPFRKYFVSDMHGKYPFPEATATTQVLVSGEKGGSQAKPLILAGLIGGLYDFIIATFGWWSETVSKSRTESQYRSRRTGTRLYHRIEIFHDYLCRFIPCLVGHHPADVRHLRCRRTDIGQRCHYSHSRKHECRTNLYDLCPPYRYRWYRDGRSYRYYQFMGNYPRSRRTGSQRTEREKYGS